MCIRDSGWDDVSPSARQFVGLSREEARAAIVDWFESHDLLADVRQYTHSVGHSYRSHAPIEPWLSDQWYVAVTDDKLRGSALRAQQTDQVPDLPNGVSERNSSSGDGELTFYPNRYARTYYSWHDGIRVIGASLVNFGGATRSPCGVVLPISLTAQFL